MADIYEAGRFKLTLKEWLQLILAMAIAFLSTRSNDVWLVVPMLFLAALTSVVICIRHKGKGWIRFLSGIVVVSILAFVGWRDLRPTSLPTPATNTAPPTPQAPSVNQHADNSDCSNVVAGGEVNMNCTTSEKPHGKNKP